MKYVLCLFMVGCANVSVSQEELGELYPVDESVIEGELPPFEYDGDDGDDITFMPDSCVCSWQSWVDGGMVCAGLLCSDNCTNLQRACVERYACVPRE